MRTLILLLTVITLASVTVAQSKKDKLEIGVQTTSLSLFHPDIPADDTQGGIGGRVTYNFNRSIAADAEFNFFPQKQFVLNADGNAIQAQFGVKIGKRFEKAGLFAKVRPGFLSADRVVSVLPGSQVPIFPDIRVERETFFSIDFGGVLELYPSKRVVVRFDGGDTAIRHPARFGQISFTDPVTLLRDAKFKHNFQFTAGVGFRLGDFPDEASAVNTASSTQERTKRFEVGIQFTSLFVNPLNPVGLTATRPRTHNEPGFGGRFTFNLTDNIAFEAEGNYFTREQSPFFQHGGKMFQGQFGGKVGKRFESWGAFAKARPGFVGFTRVFEFGIQTPPNFRFVRKLHPSLDLGGVVEFYMHPRWMARFDVGDTIIRYGDITFPFLPFTIPSATQHNLQVSSGLGFRF